MAYGKKKFRKKRYGNKKAKWREQKISVGTIQKIARRVARHEDQKNIENLYSVLNIGTPGTLESYALSRAVTKKGLSSPTMGTKDELLFHPFTTKMQVDSLLPGVTEVDSNNGTRKGNEIFLRGLAVKGTINLPAGTPACRVRISVFKCDQHFSDLYDKQTPLDGMMLRRDLETGAEKITPVIQKEFSYNPNGGNNLNREFKVNLYKKIMKKIEYNATLVDEQSCSQADFKEDRYILSIISDHNATIVPPMPTNIPQFYGMFIAYYTDA